MVWIEYIIAISIIIFWAVLLAVGFKQKFEWTFPVAIFLIIVVLYIGGIFGNLLYGIYTIYGITGIGIIISLRYKSNFIKVIIDSNKIGVIFLLICAGIFGLVHIGRELSFFDEYSHWALVVKNMFYLNKFGNVKEATTMFKDYPPAASLFEYFFVRIGNVYTEANLYRAISIFSVTLMLPYFECLKMNKKQNIFLAVIVFLIPVFFYNGYTLLTVDNLLGLLMGYLLTTYYFAQADGFKYISLLLGSFVLSLTKASGAGLMAIVIVFMALDVWNGDRKEIKWKLKCILSAVGGGILAKISWQYCLQVSGTAAVWDTDKITLESIYTGLFIDHPAYWEVTIKNFVKAMVEPVGATGFFFMSYSGWLLLIIVVGTFLAVCQNRNKRIINFTIGSLIGFGIYMISLLMCYLFIYSEEEAQEVASFSRYMDSYLMGIMYCLIIFILLYMQNKKVFTVRSMCVSIIILLAVSRPSGLIYTLSGARSTNERNREQLDSVAQLVDVKVNPDEFVVVIRGQTLNAIEELALNYYLLPAEKMVMTEAEYESMDPISRPVKEIYLD